VHAFEVIQVSSSMSPFAKEFLISEVRDLKAKYEAEHLLVGVTKFLSESTEALEPLQKYLRRVLAMHAANSKF
jgi:hypothetical protein